MNGFLWTAGHMGWGIFAVAVFTALWWLLADIVWRFKATRIVRFAIVLGAGWAIGVGLIVVGFVLSQG